MKNVAIIPARSGSKGLPDKNIRPLNGAPLIAYTIRAALNSGMFDEVMVSTDSEEYARIARAYGASVPFLRSEATSNDTASSWSVVREVVDNYEKLGHTVETVALLQATSPIRTGEQIREAFALMEQKQANAIISCCENGAPLFICNPLPEDHSLVGFFDDRKYRPRQVTQTVYRPNGAIYLYKVEALKTQATIYDAACYAYLMDRMHSVDVDDLVDFQMAEAIIRYLPDFGNYFD